MLDQTLAAVVAVTVTALVVAGVLAERAHHRRATARRYAAHDATMRTLTADDVDTAFRALTAHA